MFSKKQVVATHEDRIGQAKDQVLDALDVFEKAKANVLKANENLNVVGTELDEEIARLTRLRANVHIKVAQHDDLIKKFDQFTISN